MKIPPELKISPSDLVKKSAKDLPEEVKNDREKKPTETLPSAYAKETLAIVINIWRIKFRMTDALSKEPKEELTKEDVKKIVRYLESIHDSFAQLGIEIIDRTGESFDYGLPEKVVTTKPQEGIRKELVLETLRPTIKWNNQMYPGEVEIATPIENLTKENHEPHNR